VHPPRSELAGKAVLILSGERDPLMSADGAARLAAALTASGAMVTHRTLPVGHELSQADVTLAREWLEQRDDDTVRERARR
jgi:phospholipase/carboxylesterase